MVEDEYYNIFGITKLCDDYSKIQNSDKEKLSAYLHERIHYIQNFTTVYGVYKSLVSMSDYLGRIFQIQQGKFPNKPYKSESQICLLRYYLYKMGLGDIQFEYLENTPFRN